MHIPTTLPLNSVRKKIKLRFNNRLRIKLMKSFSEYLVEVKKFPILSPDEFAGKDKPEFQVIYINKIGNKASINVRVADVKDAPIVAKRVLKSKFVKLVSVKKVK